MVASTEGPVGNQATEYSHRLRLSTETIATPPPSWAHFRVSCVNIKSEEHLCPISTGLRTGNFSGARRSISVLLKQYSGNLTSVCFLGIPAVRQVGLRCVRQTDPPFVGAYRPMRCAKSSPHLSRTP